MATLFPFRAIRPAAGRESDVASVPYDVVTREEARAIGEANEASFLHVVRPEIDLPDSVGEHDPETYNAAAKAFDRFRESGLLELDDAPGFYLYRLEEDGFVQTGIVGCADVNEYRSNVIKRHELTRPDKEDDRMRHIKTLGCHAGPVLMTFRANDLLHSAVEKACREAPLWDFTASDSVRHSAWKVPDPEEMRKAFAAVPALYIADGHHRAAAAVRIAAEHESEEAQRFLTVLFPHDEMRILAYNKYIAVDSDTAASVAREIDQRFSSRAHPDGIPQYRGEVCYCHEGVWRAFDLELPAAGNPAERLDLAVFSNEVLEPLLGVTDQRRDKRLTFVGGRNSTVELRQKVSDGGGIAFSFYPVSVEELMAVSDAGLLMPPKSTWFSPKLRSGLFLHPFS